MKKQKSLYTIKSVIKFERSLKVSVFFWGLVLISCNLISCKKFIEVDAPATSINSANVFATDQTAAAALTGIYSQMATDNKSKTGLSLLSFESGLSADEFTLSNTNSNGEFTAYYANSITSSLPGTGIWGKCYGYIYEANAAIEGLNQSNSLTPAIKKQLLGEAYFIRAFCYFYLVNLYGDVPLEITSNYKTNSSLPRTSKSDICNQIVADLQTAQISLNENYVKGNALNTYTIGTEERVRPNKYTATSLLARVYLFLGNYSNAENQANAVISNKAVYDTVGVNSVFLKNSKETIWAIQPVGSGTQANTGEGAFFIPTSGTFPSGTNPFYINQNLINTFEPSDNRLTAWLKGVTVSGSTFYYPFKYKVGLINTATVEYSVVFRLAEQYLIRAEARAMLNNITGAQQDLNVIRKRAGLPPTIASLPADLKSAILRERRVELFSEWGHRWLDLKRTMTVDEVMGTVTPSKGGTWKAEYALYPIPLVDIRANPALVQNPGYN